MLKNALLIICWFLSGLVHCQTNGCYIPREIMKAYEKGTRSPDGKPGKNYFQNKVDYNIDVEYFPDTRMVSGRSEIIFHNNSPDNLRHIVLRLYQNVFLRGGARGRKVDPDDTHDGITIKNIEINGKKFNPESIFLKTQTNIMLPVNTGSGKITRINIEWEFRMPAKTTNRFGCYGPSSCFIGYWYPQVSVYDDLYGWDFSDYTGVAEFYNNYGDFNVNIRVPGDYIVWATGELQNPEEILTEKYLNRYNTAKTSDDVIHIIGKKDLKQKSGITKNKFNVWNYTANNVNDFAFSLSNRYVWDATSTLVKQKEGYKRVLIETAYNPTAKNFHHVAEIAAWSVSDFSEDLPGIPYPYPKLTIFNGKDGMEYPMIKNNGDGDYNRTLFVTTHEIGHTYFPFLAGTDQKRYGWMDEGLVTVIAQEQHLKREKTFNFRDFYLRQYPLVAGTQEDIPPVVNSSYISNDIFQVHEYMRPSLAFWTLRDILGHDLFKECVAGFLKIWEGKHPTPWDMFFVFENISGMKLDWFFSPWFCEYAYPDLEITSVVARQNETEVVIKNTGGMPFPSSLKIMGTDGLEKTYPLPATIWKNCSEYIFRTAEIHNASLAEVITKGHPDVNTENNSRKAVKSSVFRNFVP